MSIQTQHMSISVKKCRFGPMSQRYHNGEFCEVEQYDHCKRGIAAGPNLSHSKDYKIAYVSDPLLVIYANGDFLHSEISSRLKELELWNSSLIKIDLPRTSRDSSMEWTAGFKTLPRESDRLDYYKDILKDACNDEFPTVETENFIEVTI